jgi:hypothetical protein
MKNKTIATWLAFLGGPLGLHRYYLYGFSDRFARAFPLPTLIGVYGVYRAQVFGVDDMWIGILAPILGFTISACTLTAIVYGLTSTEKWNQRFNPKAPHDAVAGQTNWLTIGAVVASLLIGATALMASLAFSFQRYFENQPSEAAYISATQSSKKSAN